METTPSKPMDTRTVPTGYPASSTHQTVPCEATASLVCGIIGLFFFGVILGTVALCLGCSAKSKIKNNPELYTGGGKATAGIILGSIGLALWVILFIFYFVAGSG